MRRALVRLATSAVAFSVEVAVGVAVVFTVGVAAVLVRVVGTLEAGFAAHRVPGRRAVVELEPFTHGAFVVALATGFRVVVVSGDAVVFVFAFAATAKGGALVTLPALIVVTVTAGVIAGVASPDVSA